MPIPVCRDNVSICLTRVDIGRVISDSGLLLWRVLNLESAPDLTSKAAMADHDIALVTCDVCGNYSKDIHPADCWSQEQSSTKPNHNCHGGLAAVNRVRGLQGVVFCTMVRASSLPRKSTLLSNALDK